MLGRLLARKRIRELVFFLVILAVALPQLLLARQRDDQSAIAFTCHAGRVAGWPWTATSNLILGQPFLALAGSALRLDLGTLAFSRWQFSRTLAFDSDAANAQTPGPAAAPGGSNGSTACLRRY